MIITMHWKAGQRRQFRWLDRYGKDPIVVQHCVMVPTHTNLIGYLADKLLHVAICLCLVAINITYHMDCPSTYKRCVGKTSTIDSESDEISSCCIDNDPLKNM